MPEDLSSSSRSSCTLDSSGEITPEGWRCARFLKNNYPPQIILWMIRELLSSKLTSFCSLDFIALTFHIEESPGAAASSSNQPLTSFTWNDFNQLLQDDELGVSTTTRSSMGESGNLESRTGTVHRQSLSGIPHAEPDVITRQTDQNDEAPNRQERRLFCVFHEHRGTSFGKRSDWRRHMNNFHKPGKKAWRCPEDECHQLFDKPNNFCQHHRKAHRCRKSCNHADRAKVRIPIKRAFACGCQDCHGLLFSWDEWCTHVAEHMENGMAIDQWQYNTLLRNLLRRPEVHHLWEQHVAREVGPYTVPARFTWRPRDTREIKWQLEYMDEVELQKDAESLVLRAYDIGLAVRSAQELLEPSIPVIEPTPSRRLSHHLNSSDSNNSFRASPLLCPPQTPRAFQLTHQQSVATLPYDVEGLRNDTSHEHFEPQDQFALPFGFYLASFSAEHPFE
jgi:hypothetical protein